MYDARRWQRYAGHRGHVHEAIDAVRSDNDRSIALVGAGRCYDADLLTLAAQFDRIVLADIDEAAVGDGIAAQGAATVESVAPFDVTSTAKLPGEAFSGIVSQCLLSQLIVPSIEVYEGDELVAAVRAVRAAHLRFLIDCIKPGGWAIVVWDVVASETTPELRNGTWTRRTIGKIAERAFAVGNYFTGLAPQLVVSTIGTDPWLKDACARHDLSRPWIWTDDPDHARIVYALTLHRRS